MSPRPRSPATRNSGGSATGVTLDSCVLVDILAGDWHALGEVERLESGGLVPVLSTVAVLEVLSGVEFTRSRADRAKVEVLLRQIPIEAFDLDAARRSGELRAELRQLERHPARIRLAPVES